jgi:hypothetical protein
MKKATIIIGILLVIAALSIGINIGVFYHPQTGNIEPTATPAPSSQATTNPTAPSTQNPTNSGLTINYQEQSNQTSGGQTQLTLSVTVKTNSTQTVTINKSQFQLFLQINRGGLLQFELPITGGTASPKESGSVTVGASSQSTFTLTFTFATQYENIDGATPVIGYYMQYNNGAENITCTRL